VSGERITEIVSVFTLAEWSGMDYN